MTISGTYSPIIFVGNGTQATWPVNYQLYATDEVCLGLVDSNNIVTQLVYGTDYTVTRGPQGNGGTVHYPAAAGQRLVVWLATHILQELDLTPTGKLDAEALEDGLDRLTLIALQHADTLNRCVKISVSSTEKPKTAEQIYAEVNEIADRAEDAVEKAEDAASRAEKATGQIHALYATASGVPHTASVAALYNADNGELHFDIPRGEPGPPGTVPALDCIDGGRAHQTQVTTIDGGVACQPI